MVGSLRMRSRTGRWQLGREAAAVKYIDVNSDMEGTRSAFPPTNALLDAYDHCWYFVYLNAKIQMLQTMMASYVQYVLVW